MKKYSFYYFLLLTILGGTSTLMGQVDTIISIPIVEVQAHKIREKVIGGTVEEWDRSKLAQTSLQGITEVLEQESGLYLKSYGLGSLATSSIRGGSAGHTLVLWNGLPIHSPMLGLLDLSLLPTGAIDQLSFQKGGNAALWGSSAIGGLISLNNRADFSKGTSISIQSIYGNFDRFQQDLKFRIGHGKLQSSTSLSYASAENNFKYTLAPQLPKREQSNAALIQHNLVQNLYWKINARNSLALHYWYQYSDREIPPTNSQTRSEAYQIDGSNRLSLDWQYNGKKNIYQAKAAYFTENLDYFNDPINLASLSRFNSIIGEISAQRSIDNQHTLLLGVTQTLTTAEADGYQNREEESRTAFFTSLKGEKKRWAWQASLRQAIIDQVLAPLVPTIAADYHLLPTFSIKGKISRNYRLPTLNDRFWRPGGNSLLRAEVGWSQELSFITTKTIGRIKLFSSITTFNRNIDDWILWSIKEGQSFWSANNITKVWSRGLEPRFKLAYQHKQLNINWNLGYDYIRSTNQVALENPRIAQGAQLIYTPLHQAFTHLSVHWNNISANYHHRFTGKTQGLNESIDAFQVGNSSLQYHLSNETLSGKIFIHFNNIWNTEYFVIDRRPMPGTNYRIGIKFSYQNNHK